MTFVGALNACASVVALEEGKCIHELIIQSGCESDVFVGNSLMDMYVKCGRRMLGECSIRCPHAMWSLGISCLGDMPRRGMA